MVDYFLNKSSLFNRRERGGYLKTIVHKHDVIKMLKETIRFNFKKRLSMSEISSQRLGVFETKFQHCLFVTDEYTLNTTSQNKTIR